MYLPRQIISSIEALILKNEFNHIQRAFIVPTNKIKLFIHELVEIDNKELALGKFYLNHFLNLMDLKTDQYHRPIIRNTFQRI